jgi:hypothetical protein
VAASHRQPCCTGHRAQFAARHPRPRGPARDTVQMPLLVWATRPRSGPATPTHEPLQNRAHRKGLRDDLCRFLSKDIPLKLRPVLRKLIGSRTSGKRLPGLRRMTSVPTTPPAPPLWAFSIHLRQSHPTCSTAGQPACQGSRTRRILPAVQQVGDTRRASSMRGVPDGLAVLTARHAGGTCPITSTHAVTGCVLH